MMGFGILLRDHEGRFLAAKCIERVGLWDSSAAEALAVFYGAIFGKERGVQHIVIEEDAKQITDAIQEKGKELQQDWAFG